MLVGKLEGKLVNVGTLAGKELAGCRSASTDGIKPLLNDG